MRQIVVGFADVGTAHDAVRQAVDLAQGLGASLHVVMAIENDASGAVRVGTDEWQVSEGNFAESTIRNFIDALPGEVDCTVGVAEGAPADVLVSEAQRLQADLIVVGNVRMQGIGRVLGSVGNGVIRQAPCSVLVVKTA
jgi:nucleotide-binding universal stress UspA family protein